MFHARQRRSSVLLRYALSYTAVVMVLLLSVTGYLYVLMGRQARESIITSQINRLSRIASQHEVYLSTMLSAAEEIGLSPHLEAFSYEKEPWKAYELQLQLIPYTASADFCDQIYLHFTGDDRIYSSSSGMTVDLFTRMMRYERVNAEELRQLIFHPRELTVLPSQHLTSSLIDGGGMEVVTFVVPLGANPATSKGSLLFLVKDSVYQSLFSDAIDGEINTYILQNGGVLAAAEDLPVPAEEVLEAGENQQETSGLFRWNGEDWLLVALRGRSWGLTYQAVLRNADVSGSVRSQMTGIFAVLGGIALASLALALWMARRHARPIQVISGLLTEGEKPEDELQHISTGIRQLTSRNTELIHRLDSALPMQRHDFVFRFIKGRFFTREEAVEAARAVDMDIDRPWYAVILCGLPENWDQSLNLDRLSGFEDVTGTGVELVVLKGVLYLAFARQAERLPLLAEALRRAGDGEGNCCVTSISALHQDFQEAPSAYLEAAAAYDNRFARGAETVLAYDEVSASVADVMPRAEKITLGISQALALGNREMLNERIGELLHFLKNTHMSPFAFRMVYNHVIDTLTRSQAEELSGNTRGLYDIFSLSSCQSIDDLDELLRRLCDTLLSAREGPEKTPEEDEIDQAIHYMEEHFSDPEISMAAIAESFGLSTTRLSVSFREKTSMTPLEYLTMLRCEHARELLENTGMTIRDISVQVGYYDSGSFIRRFKQMTGETPLQYRRSHGGNQA